MMGRKKRKLIMRRAKKVRPVGMQENREKIMLQSLETKEYTKNIIIKHEASNYPPCQPKKPQ